MQATLHLRVCCVFLLTFCRYVWSWHTSLRTMHNRSAHTSRSNNSKISIREYSWSHHRPDIQECGGPLQGYSRAISKAVRSIDIADLIAELWRTPIGDHHSDVHTTDGHVEVPFDPCPASISWLQFLLLCKLLVGYCLKSLIGSLGATHDGTIHR